MYEVVKTLSFHIMDIAVVKLQLYHGEHPDNEALKCPQKFAIAEYQEDLVRDLAGLNEYGQPPVFKPPTREPGELGTVHIPKFTNTKRDCKVRYESTQKELKVRSHCSAPQLNHGYLHCT